MAGNFSISPSDVNQTMWAQRYPQLAQNSGASTSAFGNLNLQGPSADCFEKSEDKGGIPWKGIGIALAIGALCLGFKKYAGGQTGWQKIAAFFKGNAAGKAVDAASGKISEAKSALVQALPKEEQKALAVLQKSRNAAFTENIEKLLSQYGIAKDKAFEALKGCSNVDQMKNKLVELSRNSDAATKLTSESNNVFDALKNWLEKTNKYNEAKNPIRELAKRLVNQSAGYLKDVRTGEYGKLGDIKTLIEKQPEDFQKEIFKLADEGKKEDIVKNLNSIIGKESVLGTAQIETKQISAWVDASKAYAGNQSALTNVKLENALRGNQEYYEDVFSKLTKAQRGKVHQLIKQGTMPQDAIKQVCQNNNIPATASTYTDYSTLLKS